jgi:hypothetical protein
MKRVKINFAIIAVLLATGAAFAAKKPATDPTTYGYNGTTIKWVAITGHYTCTGNTPNCTEQFVGDPNNGGTPIPSTLVKGVFHQ